MTTIEDLPYRHAEINLADVLQIRHDWRDLSAFGFGTFNRGSEQTEAERKVQFAESRERMLTDYALDELTRARRWLQLFPKVKAINQTGTSYGLKHQAERVIGYTMNGMFIAAAIAEGFKIKQVGPNALLNISRLAWYPTSEMQRSLTALRCEIEADGCRVWWHD